MAHSPTPPTDPSGPSTAPVQQDHGVKVDTTGVFQVATKVKVNLRFKFLDADGVSRYFPPAYEHEVRIVYKDGSVETYRGDSVDGNVSFETKRAKESFTVEFAFSDPVYIVNEPLGRKDMPMSSQYDRTKAEEYAFPPKAIVADIVRVRATSEKEVFDNARQKAREKAEQQQTALTPTDAQKIKEAGDKAAKEYVITEEDRRLAKSEADKGEKEAKDFYNDNPPAWYRVFELPKKITLKNSDWKVEHKQYDAAKFEFDLKTDKPREIGTEKAPVKLTLDPHWQYIKFEYFDRYFGHSDHSHKPISALPQMLEGYEGEPGKLDADANARKDKWKTRSNWVISKDDKLENAVQCLPWIIQRSDDGATPQARPADNTTLAFFTEEDYRWIKALEKDKRFVLKLDSGSDDAKPCANRLRWYDLPAIWKSRKYWCRWSDKDDEQNLYEEMAKKVTQEHKDKKAAKTKPLIFCLDDMVLTREKAGEVVPLAIDQNDRPTVFYHEFRQPPSGNGGRAGATFSDVGIYKPGLRRGPAIAKAKDDAKAAKKAELEKKARDDAEKAKKTELEGQARTKAETDARALEETQARQKAEEQARLASKNDVEIGQAGDEAVSKVAGDVEAQKRIKAAGDKAVKDLETDATAQQKITLAGDTAVSNLSTDATANTAIDTAGTQAGTQHAAKEDAASGYPYSTIPLRGTDRNYIADYPHWTRLAIVAGNMFDVFEKRTEQDLSKPDNAARPVGARAAVNWKNAVTSEDSGVGVAPGTARPNCDRINKPFFAIQPYYKQEYSGKSGGGKTIGRLDVAVLRCCDASTGGTREERAVNLHYIRFNFNYTEAPAKYKSPTVDYLNNQAELAGNAVDGIAKRWNGADGAYNPGNAIIARVATTADPTPPKLETKVVWLTQVVRESHAHFRVGFTPETGTSSMNVNGTGKMRELAASNQSTAFEARGFVMCHETGHGASLPDEYLDKKGCAYGMQPIIPLHIPGDPFHADKPGDFPMMNWNHTIRPRYYWHSAEFLRCLYGHSYELRHSGFNYKLPEHANNAQSGAARPPTTKTYAYWPYKQTLDADPSLGRGVCDVLFYALGAEPYSHGKLKAGQQFDGLIYCQVKCKMLFAEDDAWTTSGGVVKGTHGRIVYLLGEMNKRLNNMFNKKFAAQGKVNGRQFNNCLLEFRFSYLVETSVDEAIQGNQDYLKAYGGTTLADQQLAYDNAVTALESSPGVHLTIEEDAGSDNMDLGGAYMSLTDTNAISFVTWYMCDWFGIPHNAGAYQAPQHAHFKKLVETVMTDVTTKSV